jgi:uncharacterized membrane protein YcaP (DUF421 family)
MQVVARAAVLFVFVWVVLRAMGRKELSELSSFELVLLIVMGDLIQQGVTGDDRSVVGAMLAVSTMALMVIAFSYASFRSARARNALEGVPVIVLRDGSLLMDVLRIERLTEEEVVSAAREQNIADLSDIRIGVLEADGRFSFLRSEHNEGSAQPRDRQAT